MDTTSPTPHRSLRVLIAEDDDDLRVLLAQTLEEEGHDVVELEDGFELGDYVEVSNRSVTGRTRPDVIITDVRMPGRDGLEVVRQARKAGLTCPIIVVSAFADAATRQASAELGDATFLAKPLDVNAVAASVSRVARRATDEARSSRA
ncbi:MAG: response regulator [Myxococcales bacterium]